MWDVVENAKLITRNYELLQEATRYHEYLQKAIEGDHLQEEYPRRKRR